MYPRRILREKRKYPAAAQSALAIRPARGREVYNALSGIPASAAQIRVLEEQEKALVETAELFTEIAPNHKAAARHPIYVARDVWIPVPLKVAPHTKLEDIPQHRPLDEDVERTRETPVRISDGAVVIDQFGRENSYHCIMFHSVNHLGHGIGRQYLGGIVHKDVFAARAAEPDVVPVPEAEIALRLDEADLRSRKPDAIANVSDRVVVRMIVHDQNLHPVRGGLMQKRVGAPPGVLASAVI